MTILEIGGGLGSVTELLIEGLGHDKNNSRFGRLDYTDASPDNVANARTKFAEACNIGFKVLDISQDPQAQGLECGTYDIVVASMVCPLLTLIYFTSLNSWQITREASTLKTILQNARKLLKS